jgi:hypothetical protein
MNTSISFAKVTLSALWIVQRIVFADTFVSVQPPVVVDFRTCGLPGASQLEPPESLVSIYSPNLLSTLVCCRWCNRVFKHSPSHANHWSRSCSKASGSTGTAAANRRTLAPHAVLQAGSHQRLVAPNFESYLKQKSLYEVRSAVAICRSCALFRLLSRNPSSWDW